MVLEHSWCPLCGKQFLGRLIMKHSCDMQEEAGATTGQDCTENEAQNETKKLKEGE